MIKIEHPVFPSPEQMDFIIEGVRNPMDSHKLSDSFKCTDTNACQGCPSNGGDRCRSFSPIGGMTLGDKDFALMGKLAKAGSDHRKYLRMMQVGVRITAPLYVWHEIDTYKVGTVRNSCSFMHKGVSNEFDINDFSIMDERIYEILSPIKKKEYKLEYPYEVSDDDYRIFTDHNGKTYKVYRNGYVLREAFTYTDSYGTGRTRHFKEAPVTIYQNRNGYFIVKLSGRNGGHMQLHRMVASVWCDKKDENYNQVNHIDGNKGNNCAENLEWVTASENMQKGVEQGLYKELSGLHKTYRTWKSKTKIISTKDRAEFLLDVRNGLTYTELAEKWEITKKQANQLKYALPRSENEDLFQLCFYYENLIESLNYLRALYLETKDEKIFQTIRGMLPQGYLQTANLTLNYEVLLNMYFSRRNHRLDEWREFCQWMLDNVPYFKELVDYIEKGDNKVSKRIKFSYVGKDEKVKSLKEFFSAEGFKVPDEELAAMTVELPKRATKGSAGYDCYSPIGFCLEPGQEIKLPTLLKAYMPQDIFLGAYPRSGLGFKYYARLANTVGIVDSDYADNEGNEGHIFVKIRNEGDKPMSINPGDGICQFIFQKYFTTEDDEAEGTREGGFGSTDK